MLDVACTRLPRLAFAVLLGLAVAAVVVGASLSGALAPGHRNLYEAPIVAHNLLRAHGTFRLEPAGDGATRRTAEGELKVSVPFVGGKVEQAIVSGLREHAALEQGAIAGLASSHGVTVEGADCVDVSFPGFFELLPQLDVVRA